MDKICIKCKEKKKIHGGGLCRHCYDVVNNERIKKTSKAWRMRNPDKVKYSFEKISLNGMRQEVSERDNFQCSMCGMSQEQHILLFNKRLLIHHKDEMGRQSEKPNHEIDNLLTVCYRCHNTIHKSRSAKKKYEGLLDQDDSEWMYPKIRAMVYDKKEEFRTIKESKESVAKQLGMKVSGIDHFCYARKLSLNKKMTRVSK